MNDTRKKDYIQALRDIDYAQIALKTAISQAIALFKNYEDMPAVKARATLAPLYTYLINIKGDLDSIFNLRGMDEAIKEVQRNYNLVDMIKETQKQFDSFSNTYQWVYLELKDNDYGDNENFKALREALCTVGDLINEDYETWEIPEEEEE